MTGETRRFLRHPADAPIRYSLREVITDERDYLRNIGEGGLCLESAQSSQWNSPSITRTRVSVRTSPGACMFMGWIRM
ncbi:hypothetical protein Atep_21910 [Allochromatium tepidum]|uniref:PilZ domain-containing protein n=1 Tax=Allochromatium tepidum TaxID=553982 RepID=A0ABM7QP53_9GAMM|nr:hypothetical protein Atep_21910 [Allochromatium tepidum]